MVNTSCDEGRSDDQSVHGAPFGVHIRGTEESTFQVHRLWARLGQVDGATRCQVARLKACITTGSHSVRSGYL